MKTQILFFSFLCIYAFSVQAQVQQRQSTLPSAPERAGNWFHQTQPGFKPDHIVVPAKRNMFSPNAYAWQWDTIICYTVASGSNPSQRVTRTYNAIGDTVVQLIEQRPGSLLWENYARETDAYDPSGNWVYQLQQRWQNNAWVNFQKQEFVYDANGNQVDWKRMIWDSLAWDNMWHYSNHFNTNDKIDTSIYQQGQDSLWLNHLLWIVAWDDNGNDTSVLKKTWINNDWAVSNLDTHTYDSVGNPFTYLQQTWLNSSWVNYILQSFTWDTAGNCITSKLQQWQNSTWENVIKDSSIYNPDGDKIENIGQNWSGGAWVNGHHELNVYNTSHDKLSETSQYWVNGNWRSEYRVEYTYDSLGNSLTGIGAHYSYTNTWEPCDLGLCVFADHQQEIVLEQIYHYTAVVDSVLVYAEPTHSPGQVSLFPSPAHSIVYLSSPGASNDQNRSLTMYDLRGRLVLTNQLVNEKTGIDVSGLKPGVYIVRFKDNQSTKVLKFVKN